MSFIENAKTYTGRDLETIFFRPMLSGQSALDLGVRILYNMPAPTTVQLWERSGDILQQYTAAGWTGGDPARKLQKTIDMSKGKAELGYSAADYFSMIYELITNRADVNMDDLTGTELEQAETELFKRAIAESLRVTMWIGDKEAGGVVLLKIIYNAMTMFSIPAPLQPFVKGLILLVVIVSDKYMERRHEKV